mgnify:CR=1 FL=1|jgi:hypothetical protein
MNPDITTIIARTRSSLTEAKAAGNAAEVKRLERYLRRLLFELEPQSECHHLNHYDASR